MQDLLGTCRLSAWFCLLGGSPQFFAVFLLSGSLFLMFLLPFAYAETDWLDVVKTCDEFQERVEDYLRNLPDAGTLQTNQRQAIDAEISKIFRIACSSRFSKCNFDGCSPLEKEQIRDSLTSNQKEVEAAVVAKSPTKGDEMLQKSGEPVLTKKKFGESLVAEKDPLAWLKLNWDCEGFREQVEVRYMNFGGIEFLPAHKKAELDTVLQEACSKRFAACKFEHCKLIEK